jgi:hypothetical protein
VNWRNLIFNNLGWKLFSLLIAMIIWSTYHTGEEGMIDIGGNLFEDKVTRDIIGYHVQLLSQQDTSQRVELNPEDITITLRGAPEVMNPLALPDVLAFVDLANLRPGVTNVIPISVRVPAGVRVVSVSPTNINVRIVEETTVPAEK